MSVLDSWSIEIQFSAGVWSDVTDDVIVADTVRCDTGFIDNGPTDRVARTGNLTFSLDNSTNNSAGLAGYYSPGHGNVRAGFEVGVPVRLCVSFEGITKTKFYGRIAKDGITPDTGPYDKRRTRVVAVDYMNQLSTHELFLPAYTTNKRMDEIMPLITGNMPLAPLSTSYDTGVETFTSVFDTVTSKTSALSEVQKLALSEWGYCYISHSSDYDEILRFENQNARDEASYAVIPESVDESGYLLMENGDYLLQENGDKLILDVSRPTDFFIDSSIGAKVSYGKHLANQITVTSYPRAYDASATVLYSLPSAISLAAGTTRTLVANFTDPNNKAVQVAGKTMESPAATTDYLMNSSAEGTATNLTANLSVSVTYGANAGSYALENTGTTDGYITKLQARGIGIYLYDPIEYVAVGTASQANLGLHTLDVEMTYQDNPTQAERIGGFLAADALSPMYEMESYPFYANKNGSHMMAFVFLEIGQKIQIIETQSGFNKDIFIDGISFEIHPNSIVKCTYKTRFASSLVGWQLGVDGKSELGETTILG